MLSLEDVVDNDTPKEDVVEIADTIAQMTNETFPDWVKHAFNCPEDRKHTIQTDREIVSDKSLFLTKKRYILHVINDEGAWVDKMKIMGVELKKSNVSDFTKYALKSLVDMILDDRSMYEVKERIVELKEEFKQKPLKEIGVPSGCKTLKDAQETYEKTGSLKGIHISAKSAIHYNERCSHMDRPIMPGEKVLILYVKDRMGSLALPIESNSYPEWVYSFVVDYDKMWSKVDKTITNYLESLGWDIQSQKDAIKDEIFGF